MCDVGCWPLWISTRMKIIRAKKCPYCGVKFKANIRVKDRQITCGTKRCRRTHHARYRRRYRRLNWEEELGYQKKRKESRPQDYWRTYRKRRRQATLKNTFWVMLRKRLYKSGLQRQLDILEVIEIPSRIFMFHKFATSNRSLILKCLR